MYLPHWKINWSWVREELIAFLYKRAVSGLSQVPKQLPQIKHFNLPTGLSTDRMVTKLYANVSVHRSVSQPPSRIAQEPQF
jgi:hypothetical protein